MKYNEISESIIYFINSTILQDSNSGLTENTSLIEFGVINSLQTLQLIVFIRKKFNCDIPDESVNLNNFRNVKSITSLIMSITTEEEKQL